MDGMLVMAATTAMSCVYGWWENRRHQRNLDRVPIRIHVNGAHASTVTRLVAAGLRAGGVRTFAKTSGSLARAILPDGTEYPVFRASRPNALEQVRMVRAATHFGAEAIVLECLRPLHHLQSSCEPRLLRSTHGVTTDAFDTHWDVLGPSTKHAALQLAATVPIRGRLFTTEHRHLNTLDAAAGDRQTQLIAVNNRGVCDVGDAELDRFEYLELAQNVALALRVCGDLGVDRTTALDGMWRAKPDPDALLLTRFELGKRKVYFANGFGVRGFASAETSWPLFRERFGQGLRKVIVIYCRKDRLGQLNRLAATFADCQPTDYFLLLGIGTDVFRRVAIANGIMASQLESHEGTEMPAAAETILANTSGDLAIMGIGCCCDLGRTMAECLQGMAQPNTSNGMPRRRGRVCQLVGTATNVSRLEAA